jgi:diadenylate cyclase
MNFWQEIWGKISGFATEYIAKPICSMSWFDLADILILAFLLYQLYRFGKNRRAGRVLLGLTVVIVVGIAVSLLRLRALSYIAGLFAASAFFCIVVIFQPELRDALERLGNSRFLNPGSRTISRKRVHTAEVVVSETVDAVFRMSESHTGALIVFEGLTKLGDYMGDCTFIDSQISSKLLRNIFYDKSPLHDGALIIRNMRICAASCVLPSARGKMDYGSMGTRHRAAVGVTEVSDALVVVVSEQTGIVSIAQNGKLLRELDPDTLRDILMTYIAGNAYLRQKRANMRAEYLKMLDNIAQVKLPQKKEKRSAEEFDRQIEEFISDSTSSQEEQEKSLGESAVPDKDGVLDSEDSENQKI